MTSAPPRPPLAGNHEQRQALVNCLVRGAFTESAACHCLQIPDFDAIEGDARLHVLARATASDLQTLLLRLFLLGGTVDVPTFAAVCGADEASAFVETGLLAIFRQAGDGAPLVYSPVRLVPLSDGAGRTLLIASDRGDHFDGAPFVPFADIVFSGHNPLTRQFLRLLPQTPTGSALDLCSGTGIGALVAESAARDVVAVDITERCTDFAIFNCWLNASERVQVRCGSLYDPVRGARFDRILAHPPYVPALSERLIYRDGGESGDRLLRQIIEGLPEFLNVGGTCHVLSIGMDTAEGPYESRVRRWLGEAAPEFDIIFAFGSAMPAEEFARSLVTRSATSEPGDFEKWLELFARLEVREVVYGALVARRFDSASGEAQTRRVVAGPGTGPASFESLLRWFDWLRRPDLDARVMASRPTLAAGAELDVHHRVVDGRFVAQTFGLSNDEAPFRVQLKTDGWVATILDALNGQRAVSDLFDGATQVGTLPSTMTRREFIDAICLLIERGFLVLDPASL